MKHLLFVFVLLFVLSVPSFAQDVESTVEANPVSIVTAEAPVNTTVEDGGVNVVINNPVDETPAPVPPTQDNSPLAWIALGLSALTTILVVGSLALQRFGNRAETISNDPSAISLLERGYETVLPDMVKSIVQPLKESLERSDQAVDKLLALLNKITDGVPESSKPVPPAPTTSVASTPYASTSTLSGINPDASASPLP